VCSVVKLVRSPPFLTPSAASKRAHSFVLPKVRLHAEARPVSALLPEISRRFRQQSSSCFTRSLQQANNDPFDPEALGSAPRTVQRRAERVVRLQAKRPYGSKVQVCVRLCVLESQSSLACTPKIAKPRLQQSKQPQTGRAAWLTLSERVGGSLSAGRRKESLGALQTSSCLCSTATQAYTSR